MFDLFRSRDKAVRALLTVLLGLVALSMVTYLIPGSGSGYGSGATDDKTVVAQVGKEEITAQEVNKAIQNMTRSRQLPPDLLSIYVPQIVNQMINERVMAYEALRIGIRAGDEETDTAIIDSLPQQLVKDGKVDSGSLNALLQAEGMTLADLKTSTARQVVINKLEAIISQGVTVSPKEVEEEFRHRNEKVKIQYAFLTSARYQAEAEPTETEIKSFYDKHQAEFRTPEKKSYGVIVLDPAKIGAANMPSEAQIQAEYNSRRNDFQVAERVKARHILLKADASNDATVKPKAEALLKQIQGGADFAKLAKENSEDPGSKDLGGEVGWMVRGQMVPEFEKAGFSLKVGETSGLVKTTYGYHILQVEAHEQAHLQPLDDVRAQIVTDYQKRLASQQLQSLADKATAELRKDPLHPEKAAEAVGTTAIRAENIQAGDPVPGVGVSKEFNDLVGALRKGEAMAGPVVLQDGKAVIASVTEVQAAHPASYEEARGEAKTRAGQDKLNTLLQDKSTQLMAKAQNYNGDLEKAAKELKIEIKTSGDVDRQGALEGVGTASTIPELFSKAAGSLIGPASVNGGRLVAKVVTKTPADLATLTAQTDAIRTDLKQKKSRDRAQLFQEGLKDKLKADKTLKIHDDVIQRLVANYKRG